MKTSRNAEDEKREKEKILLKNLEIKRVESAACRVGKSQAPGGAHLKQEDDRMMEKERKHALLVRKE